MSIVATERGANGLKLILLVTAIAPIGCASPHYPVPTAADSTGTITGDLVGGFIHGGNPFYGSIVYLIPVTQSTEDWWMTLSRPRYALVDPQNDRWLAYTDRTTCSPRGQFQFSRAPPGDYYVYARVIWAYASGDSTTGFGGSAWVGTATATVRETIRVILRTPNALFHGAAPVRRFPRRLHPTDPDLPGFGEFVYVEELPEATTKVPPVYPPKAIKAGIVGTVMVQALVGKDGRVRDTRVVKSIPMLDQAAEAAVRRWVFKPALTNNKPVAVWVAVPVKFNP